MNVYHQELMDHYHHPRNRGTLPAPTLVSALHNPSCGDSISWHGMIKNNHITALAFQGSGCVISQATASMLSVACINKSAQEVLSYDTQWILNLIGITLGPTRIKCALLALEALQQALQQYHTQKAGTE
jgi:nitrogen fixation NifU-like protein